ncbi:NACHT domain-containing protein [Paenarthrobacter sp. CC6]|uniref:NACHT domain-containing protein n=1 Tax=Paenarthrobacter sp. CC6 TaxID=3029184 RepID=UPI00339D2958
MTGIIEAVAIKSIEAAVTAAAKKAGEQLWTGVNPFTKRNKKKAEVLLQLIQSLDFTDQLSLIGLLQDLPSGVSLARIEETLTSLPTKSVTQELISGHLVHTAPKRLATIRENFQLSLLQQLQLESSPDIKKFAEAVLAKLENAITRIINEYRLIDPTGFEQMQTLAAASLIDATMQAIDRHNSLLSRYDSPSNYRHLKTWMQDYRHQAAAAHGFISPPDLERKRKVPMDLLYVPPSIQSKNLNDEDQEWNLDEFANNINRTVLLGDPGGGKSTAASYIAYKNAKDDRARLPFIIVLRDFAKDDDIEKSISSYIEERCSTLYQCTPPEGAIEHLLLNGEALVIFDGLDELIDTTKRREVTQRVELFSERYPLSQALVTSRRVGYEQAQLDPSTFRSYVLGGFEADDVALYVRNWFMSVEALDGGELDTAVSNFIDESSNVPDLTSTPLMLALLCIIYLGQGYIPKNRPAVYENCALLLFQRWDSDRKIFVELRASNEVDAAIKHLAYWMLTDQAGTEAVTESDLVAETSEFLASTFENAKERTLAAKEFVEFCRGRAWVFTDAGTTKDGEALFKFTHRTFMEYFAAFELTRITDGPTEVAKVLRPHLAKQEWDVVAQLAVQISNKHSKDGATRIFEVLLSEKRRRSNASRDSIHSFIWRCLTFLPAKPQTLRRLVNASLDSSYNLSISGKATGGGSPSIFRAVQILPEMRSVVADALLEGLQHFSREDNEERQTFGRLLLASWRMAGHRLEPQGHATEWWKAWADRQVQDNLQLLLEEGPWEKDMWRIALLLGHIDMDAYLDKAKNWNGRLLDPLFEAQSISLFGGSYLDWASVILGNKAWTSNPDLKQRRFSQLRQLGRQLDPAAETPWLSMPLEADIWMHRWVWAHDSEQFENDDDVAWAVWVLLCAMLEVKEHLIRGAHRSSDGADDFTDRLLLHRSSTTLPTADVFSNTPFDSFDGERKTFRDAWTSGKIHITDRAQS